MKQTMRFQISILHARRVVTMGLIVVVALALAAPAASAQTYMFNRADYATGAGPQTLAVGDFNNDGIMDIVAGNTHDSSSNNVSVLMGKADGTFATAVDYATVGEPSAVAVGDFNNDGKLDIVVVYGVFNAQVAVLLGNGNGTFQTTPIVSPAGPLGVSLAVGDFNGDGKLDIAIADNETPNNGVDVMLGDGTGKFGTVQQNHTAADPRMVVVADFNGDAKLDLATVSAGSSSVSVLLGDGHGGFTSATNSPYSTGQGGCISIEAGDLRHVGKIDLIAGCQTSGVIEVLLSKGDGTFVPPSAAETFTVPAGVDDLVVGDFNGDGKLDLAASNGQSVGMVSVLTGTGTGKLKSALAFGTGLFPSAVAAADFNRDGKLDLVTAVTPNLSGPPTGAISVLLTNGKTLFDGRSTYAIGTSSSDANSIAAGDLNGDKKLDLVLSQSFAGQIAVLINKGNGTFKTFVPYADPYGPMSVITGDFNNQHLTDVAVLNANTDSSGRYTVSVFSNTGTGGVLSQPVEYPVAGGAGGSSFTGANAIAVGDFNKDGHLDIVTTGTSSAGFTASVLLGTGAGFQVYQSYATGGKTAPTGVVVADFNNDGWLDFAVGNSADNTVSIFLNKADGSGTFTLQQPLTAVGGNPVTLAAGSFRGNNTYDLAIALGGAFPDSQS